MELFTMGIDLGKTTFHLVGMNQRGEVLLRKRFSRSQLLHFTANLKVDLIGMEACGGAHFLGRALRDQGHEVRLIPAQYVKPYVKTNKSDYQWRQPFPGSIQQAQSGQVHPVSTSMASLNSGVYMLRANFLGRNHLGRR
jgi:transposase